MVNVFFSNNSY